VTGRVYIFMVPIDNEVERVEYTLTDPGRSNIDQTTSKCAPFHYLTTSSGGNCGAALAFDTAGLAAGTYRLEAEIRYKESHQRPIVTADFTIAPFGG
jgi:hypothetical protein